MGIIQSSDSQSYNKPIALCGCNDILKILKEHEFQDGEIVAKIKKEKLTGYVFVELAKAIQMKENIQQAEDDVISELSKRLGANTESVRNLIRKVISPKIEHDFKMVDRFQNVPASSDVSDNDAITPISMDPTIQLTQPKFTTTIDLEMPFLNVDLTTEEIKQVEFCLEKLKGHFGEEQIGEDFSLMAQNMICKDRFLSKIFISTLASQTSRRDTKQPVSVPVKLVISQLGMNQTIVNLASKVSHTEYGILHTGLIVGEWKIDWFNNSLVVVKIGSSMNASNAIAVIDLGYLNTKEQVKDAFMSISSICCDYNGTKTYNRQNCNCQHLVSDILQALGMKLPENQVFNRYFKELKKGAQKRKYYYTETLKSMIQDKSSATPDTLQYYERAKIVFDQRKMLDQFCYWLDSLGYFQTKEGEMDYNLLKAFDRSFCLANKDDCTVYYDYENEILKDGSFFSKSGERWDNSIRKIKYNIQDLDLSDCFPRVY